MDLTLHIDQDVVESLQKIIINILRRRAAEYVGSALVVVFGFNTFFERRRAAEY